MVRDETIRVSIVPITGRENIYYDVRLVRQGLSLLVNTLQDRSLAQALASDLFEFIRGLKHEVTLDNYALLTRTQHMRQDPKVSGGKPVSAEVREHLKERDEPYNKPKGTNASSKKATRRG